MAYALSEPNARHTSTKKTKKTKKKKRYEKKYENNHHKLAGEVSGGDPNAQ